MSVLSRPWAQEQNWYHCELSKGGLISIPLVAVICFPLSQLPIRYDKVKIQELSLHSKTYSWTFAWKLITINHWPNSSPSANLLFWHPPQDVTALAAYRPHPQILVWFGFCPLNCLTLTLIPSWFDLLSCLYTTFSTIPELIKFLLRLQLEAISLYGFLGSVTKDPIILCLLSFAVFHSDGASHIMHGYWSGISIWASISYIHFFLTANALPSVQTGHFSSPIWLSVSLLVLQWWLLQGYFWVQD